MANRVRLLRTEKGLTLKQVAEKVDCSIAFLSDLEKGNRGARPETWARIAEALGVKVEELREAS